MAPENENETMGATDMLPEGPPEVNKKADDVGEVELEKSVERGGVEESEEEGKGELEEGKVEGEEDDGGETEEETIEKEGSKRELKSPASERPTRERKTVERFNGDTPRSSASKTLTIEKGRGTQLKDIPNVAFKLSKRKADENLQSLHSILFGKKAKVRAVKKNIGLFSGFIWDENEEKQKLKVKEKIDKCVREKLLDFCDILNIRGVGKKEELVAKLVEFLESPHATTHVLLADKKKGKKRKSRGSAAKSPRSSKVSAGKSTKKKQKSNSQPGKKQPSSTDEEDDDISQPSHSEDDDDIISEAEHEHGDNDLEDKADNDEDEHKKLELIENASSENSTDNSDVKSKSAKKRGPAKASKKGDEVGSKHKAKVPLAKKQKVDKESPKDTVVTSSSKKKSKSSTEASVKDEEDGESTKNDAKEPTKEEVHAAVVDLLKEADFNTVMLSDILKQLGNHFGLDLIRRKSEVNEIITDVIQSKQEMNSQPGKKQKSSIDEEDDDKSQPSHSEVDEDIVPEAESEQENNDLEDKIDNDEDEHKKLELSEKVLPEKSTDNSDVKSMSAKKRGPANASKSAGKPAQKSSGLVSKKGAEAGSKRKAKAPLAKKQKVDKESLKDTSSSKKKSKSSTKALEKDEEDGESTKNDAKEPTKEEMHAAVADLLKGVDFNTVTLSDILKQLGNHFGVDLVHRKPEVKDVITDVIQAMSESDDEDGTGDDEDDEA